jgi:SAM-dependent methyltransferase
MNLQKYWAEKHLKYSKEDWIDKPTIFAKFAINYFPKNGKLLELGAGQGQDSIFFAKNGFDVLCTDFSEKALEIAKQKSKIENLKINFQLIDLEKHLPFNKESFDIVYSHLALHYFSSDRTIGLFDEIANILKPKGILAVLLNTIDDPEVTESKLIENGLYKTPSGLIKRFYAIKDLKDATENMFETVVLDNKGETYKDEIKTLVRYIGKKI